MTLWCMWRATARRWCDTSDGSLKTVNYERLRSNSVGGTKHLTWDAAAAVLLEAYATGAARVRARHVEAVVAPGRAPEHCRS